MRVHDLDSDFVKRNRVQLHVARTKKNISFDQQKALLAESPNLREATPQNVSLHAKILPLHYPGRFLNRSASVGKLAIPITQLQPIAKGGQEISPHANASAVAASTVSASATFRCHGPTADRLLRQRRRIGPIVRIPRLRFRIHGFFVFHILFFFDSAHRGSWRQNGSDFAVHRRRRSGRGHESAVERKASGRSEALGSRPFHLFLLFPFLGGDAVGGIMIVK